MYKYYYISYVFQKMISSFYWSSAKFHTKKIEIWKWLFCRKLRESRCRNIGEDQRNQISTKHKEKHNRRSKRKMVLEI